LCRKEICAKGVCRRPGNQTGKTAKSTGKKVRENKRTRGRRKDLGIRGEEKGRLHEGEVRRGEGVDKKSTDVYLGGSLSKRKRKRRREIRRGTSWKRAPKTTEKSVTCNAGVV